MTKAETCNHPLWCSHLKATASRENTTLSNLLDLLRCAKLDLPFLEGSCPSRTAGKVLRTLSYRYTPINPPVFADLFHTRRCWCAFSHAPMLTCSSESIYTRPRMGLCYLELLMHRATWTWKWTLMLSSSTEVTLAAFALQTSIPMGEASPCGHKKHFVYVLFRIMRFREIKGLWSCFPTTLPPNALISPLSCCLSWL